MTAAAIDSHALRELLVSDREWALVDTRDTRTFARRHLLLASNVPLAQVAETLPRLVPRTEVEVVVVDESAQAAQEPARQIAAIGYTNVRVLEGGLDGWAAAGGELFSGVHVPSKAFGEHVEIHDHVPAIDAAELAVLQRQSPAPIVLDSRPYVEFHEHSIPGGIDCPGAELVYRVKQLVPDETTTIVVNCAGRTRSIIGCQSLREAGIENPVFALRHGTMGWQLADLELARGETERYPDELDERALAWADVASSRAAERHGVEYVDADELRRWQTDQSRSLYVLDVRQAQEYGAGHMAGSHNAPGGQLVQATDMYIGVRNARVVLVDDTLVRARMTASWLRRLGLPRVYVLRGGVTQFDLIEGRADIAPQDPATPSRWTHEQMNAYLDWELGLVEQIERDGTVRFDA